MRSIRLGQPALMPCATPCAPERVPEREPLARVLEIELEAALSTPAGSRDHHRRARNPGLEGSKEADRPQVRIDERLQHRLRLRALERADVDVRLEDFHVEAASGREALQPEQHAGVRDGDPEAVLGPAQDHRIVDDAPRLVAERSVDALPDPARRHVPRGGELHQSKRVGSPDLDLALARHVPELHVLAKVPVVFLGGAKERGERHLVVDGERPERPAP